jgi:hypothetical protein
MATTVMESRNTYQKYNEMPPLDVQVLSSADCILSHIDLHLAVALLPMALFDLERN